MKRFQQKLHTYVRNGRFRILFSWLLAIALIAQSLAPLLAQDPGYLPPADPADRLVESWQPTPGYDPDFMVGGPALPFWEPPAKATSLAELAPPHFHTLTVINNGGQETADFQPGAYQATFHEGTVMLLVETDGLQAQLSPLNPVVSQPPFPPGSQFQLALTLRNPQTAQAPGRLVRPYHLALDLRSLLPEAPETGDWFIAFRLPDGSGWHYPVTAVHDPAGLLSAPLDRGDYTQVVVGIQSTQPNLPQPWRYQWQIPAVSTFSGAATYQFPIEVPAGRAGLTPNIDVSYSSRGLDGLSYTTGVDQGILGLGWQLNQIQISRRNVQLGGTGHHNQRVFPMHGNQFDLVINGASHYLVHYGQQPGVHLFYAENAPGLRVRQIYEPDSPGVNSDAVYWTVQTPDGTTYRLGFYDNSETGQETQFVNVEMHGDQHTGLRQDYSSLRWFVDTITDRHGNQIQYDYEKYWLLPEEYGSVITYTSRITTSRLRPTQIRYNYQTPATDSSTRVSGPHASTIDFVYHGNRLTNILLYHFSTSPYRMIDFTLSWADYQNGQTCNGRGLTTLTDVVTAIRLRSGNGSHDHLPQTTFIYQPMRNMPDGEGDTHCYVFPRLTTVDNGYGGLVSFQYDSDGRFAYIEPTIPNYTMSFYVTEIQRRDGVHANPARTTYSYSAPCYDQAEGGHMGTLPNAANCASYPGAQHFAYPNGKLVGFASTLSTHYDYNGQLLRYEESTFWRGTGVGDDIRQRQGRPVRVRLHDANNNLLQQQDTSYGRDAGTSFDFTYASQVCTTQSLPGGSGAHCIHYAYDRQGGVQYGNLSHIREEGYIGGISNRQRLVYRQYFPNTTVWVVNAIARESVYVGVAGTPINPNSSQPASETRYYYDANDLSWNAPPTAGLLKKVENLWEIEAPPTPPSPTNTPPPTATNTPLPTATNTPLPTATATHTPSPSPTPTVPPPPAPTNLHAFMENDGVSLQWEYDEKQTREVTFSVYRSQDFPVLHKWGNRIATGLRQPEYHDPAGNSSYYYVVTAVGYHGESPSVSI